MKDYIGQIEDYSKHIEINKATADIFLSRALINFKVKNYKGVIDDCQIALALSPNDAFAIKLLQKVNAIIIL